MRNNLKCIENKINNHIKEAYKIKRIIRNGKLTKKKECPNGYKWSEKEFRCKRMSPIEKINRKKGAKKARFKKKIKQSQINYKRKKSIKKRKTLNL